ncbi:MAG: hypothetical protein JWQ87_5263 [Candidatus Sulfotelmatobacter sp.]|nr:hypothetical protein [Candidatus Sulfotelmatobacter sp.]
MIFKEYDRVTIVLRGKSMAGRILLASRDTLSLMVSLDSDGDVFGVLLPLIWLDGCYLDLSTGQEACISTENVGCREPVQSFKRQGQSSQTAPTLQNSE